MFAASQKLIKQIVVPVMAISLNTHIDANSRLPAWVEHRVWYKSNCQKTNKGTLHNSLAMTNICLLQLQLRDKNSYCSTKLLPYQNPCTNFVLSPIHSILVRQCLLVILSNFCIFYECCLVSKCPFTHALQSHQISHVKNPTVDREGLVRSWSQCEPNRNLHALGENWRPLRTYIKTSQNKKK